MSILNPFELTGRARSHIIELAEPRVSLHSEVVQAFLALRAAAADSGLDLAPTSGFRDFAQQLAIWNGKFRGERPLLDRLGQPLNAHDMRPEERVRAILLWSALPGASRHHWGTEIDVIDRAALASGQRAQLLPAQFATGGVFEKLRSWLTHHCARFGFFQPYDCDRGGVQPEPWHLSYAPLSHAALAQLRLEVLEDSLDSAALEGHDTVLALLPELYRRYVLAVASPSAAALAARATSPAARPS